MKKVNTVALMLSLALGLSATGAVSQSRSRIKEPVISAERQKARLALGQLGVEYSNESLVKRAAEGDTIAVKLLIEAGLDPNTGLTAAAGAGQTETVQFLLSRGADPNRVGAGGLPLSVAARARNKLKIAELLFEAGADANARDSEGRTAIFAMLFPLREPSAEDRELFKLLLRKGADVNAKDLHADTPLIALPWLAGGPGAVVALLDSGADVNARNEGGATPLIAMIQGADVEMIKLVLARRADLNTVDKHGWTALMWAAFRNYEDVAKLLLAGGADVNLKTQAGTALSVATQYHHPAIAKLLQDAGAK